MVAKVEDDTRASICSWRGMPKNDLNSFSVMSGIFLVMSLGYS